MIHSLRHWWLARQYTKTQDAMQSAMARRDPREISESFLETMQTLTNRRDRLSEKLAKLKSASSSLAACRHD